jgi:hypothetical protein
VLCLIRDAARVTLLVRYGWVPLGVALRVDLRATCQSTSLSSFPCPSQHPFPSCLSWYLLPKASRASPGLHSYSCAWSHDEPSVGLNGPDEKDRVLVDEFHPKYVRLDNHGHPFLTAILRYLLKGVSLHQEDDHRSPVDDHG